MLIKSEEMRTAKVIETAAKDKKKGEQTWMKISTIILNLTAEFDHAKVHKAGSATQIECEEKIVALKKDIVVALHITDLILEPLQQTEFRKTLEEEPQWQPADPKEVTYEDVMNLVTVLIQSVMQLTGQGDYYHLQEGISARKKVKQNKDRLSELLTQYGHRNDGNTTPLIDQRTTDMIRHTIAERGIYPPRNVDIYLTMAPTSPTEKQKSGENAEAKK